MAHTTQCTQCHIVLNLPDNVAPGKRLKCPRCGTRFVLGGAEAKYPTSERSDHDASPDSSQELPKRGHADMSLPVSSGDLRDTFDLPLLTEEMPATETGARGAAKTQTADALALFEEKKTAPKRPTKVEARSVNRRCTTCGGVVPKGMSICSSCGVDSETGMRIELDDDLMPEAPMRPSGPPLPVTMIGMISCLGSVIMAFVSLINWMNGKAGWQYFIPICIFGAFGAVQVLRGHSAKLLVMGLTLGAMVNVFALIVVPIFEANNETVISNQRPADIDSADVAIQPVAERLDSQKLSMGIAILLIYAAVSAYLASPGVRRHYSRD